MKEMKEIVAVRMGTIIVTDAKYIHDNINSVDALICRQHVQLMASLDLGHTWERLAKAPTLFCIDDNGNPQLLNTKVFEADGVKVTMVFEGGK